MKRVLFLISLLLPPAAWAQSVSGLYVSGGIGGSFSGTLDSAQTTTRVDTNPGPLGIGALGWGFGNGLRLEIEGSDRSNGISDIKTLRTNGFLEPLSSSGGTLSMPAVMANIAYDLPLRAAKLALRPYVGAGVGYAWFDFNDAGGIGAGTLLLRDGNRYTGPDSVSFGTAGAFAYQAIAGIAVPIRAVHGLEVTMEYRFFGTARADVPVRRLGLTTNTIQGEIPSIVTDDGFFAHDNAVLVGLRYSFGGPSR